MLDILAIKESHKTDKISIDDESDYDSDSDDESVYDDKKYDKKLIEYIDNDIIKKWELPNIVKIVRKTFIKNIIYEFKWHDVSNSVNLNLGYFTILLPIIKGETINLHYRYNQNIIPISRLNCNKYTINIMIQDFYRKIIHNVNVNLPQYLAEF